MLEYWNDGLWGNGTMFIKDSLVKSPHNLIFVIPAKAGIQ